MNKPILGITMGDPFGNGPEITVRALNDKTIYDRCRPLVVGDLTSMEYALRVARKVSGINLELNPVQKVQDAKFTYGTIDVLDMGLVPADQIPDTADQDEPKPFGIGACALGGEASFQYVKKVIELAMAGEIDATITNALSKEAINMAGHHYSGHTEIYADYTHTDKYTMMLAHEDLRVVHVSTHVSLREACDRVKKARVLECIRIANEGCKALGIENPKIGVAGLNPHCGENGMFGTEEIEEIQPAIDEALAEGINIPEKKPTPPDTVFSKALGAAYYENYEDLLKEADVVTIHVPLTDQTRDMITKKQLATMKPTALLINCSRGGIVNEADLVEALKGGVIAGAGTDVYCSEPPKADDPLLHCPNLVLSPHSAAQTREAVIKMAQMCVKGCLAVCRGEKWPYVADKAVYDHPRWAGAKDAEV